ncbi:hypothetical protein BC332_13951 [Capsicum chinense]|nr:hypothetical protein BC332_13951 [Capsicum chinense]
MAQHANRSSSVRGNQPKNLVSDELPLFSLGLIQDDDFNLASTNILSKEGVSIEEVMRDQIYMARVLPKFAPHIGCHTVNNIEDRIKSMLMKNQYKIFCTKSIFDFFMKKKDCVIQAQLGRCIMSLETKKNSTSAIVICAKGIILHFTPREFALVTDLNCVTNKDDFVFDEERPNKIIDQYFDDDSFIQKKELFAAVSNKIWGKDNDKDALKFANLYFIHTFLLSSVDTVAISRLHFDLVESDRYSDYPRGTVAFEELARSLNKKLKSKGKFYMLLGMTLAIQI